MSISNSILHPGTFYTDGGSWSDGYNWFNLWSMENTALGVNGNPVVKTIYDPCPVGFCLPASDAFTGFTTTGQSTYNQSEFNINGVFNKGWDFKTNIAEDSTIFFSISGIRYQNSGTIYNYGDFAQYWTWSKYKYDRKYSSSMHFHLKGIFPEFSQHPPQGNYVRPIAETN